MRRNSMNKHDKDEGFHKVAPDPEETPRDEGVEPDNGPDGGYEATGPAHRAGAEGGETE